MASIIDFPVEIRSRSQRDLAPTPGTLSRIDFNAKDRGRNSIKTIGLFLAFASGAVLIPFWHFILVPTFFILAWVMGLEKYAEKSINAGGEGTCPHCLKKFKIGRSSWKPMMTDTCESCFQELELRPQTGDQ
jgi:hypothetical protein